MASVNLCKGCSASVRISENHIDELSNRILKAGDNKFISRKMFRERLKHCLNCQGLEYGTTCKYCGCIVRIKAKWETAKCPYPFNPKW